jgi:uncharacterized membrane protein
MQQTAPATNDKTLLWIAYACMALAFVNGFTAIAAVVIAYVKRKDSAPWIATHYTFLIRTFWVSVVVGLVGVVLMWVLIGFLVLFALAIWTIVRLVRGAIWVSEDKPVPMPNSFGFG